MDACGPDCERAESFAFFFRVEHGLLHRCLAGVTGLLSGTKAPTCFTGWAGAGAGACFLGDGALCGTAGFGAGAVLEDFSGGVIPGETELELEPVAIEGEEVGSTGIVCNEGDMATIPTRHLGGFFHWTSSWSA